MCVPIFILNSSRTHYKIKYELVVWDTQTGVVIGGANTEIVTEASTGFVEKIMFHGDQRTITLVASSQGMQLSAYNVLDGMQLCHSRIPHSWNPRLGNHWVYNDTLWLAIGFETNGTPAINICTFQPTSNPPLYIVSSFPVQSSGVQFSFSPVSFHASYYTGRNVIILNVQDSRLLFSTGHQHLAKHTFWLFTLG